MDDEISVRITLLDNGFTELDDLRHRSGLEFRQFVVSAVESQLDLARFAGVGEGIYMGSMTAVTCKIELFGIHMPWEQSRALLGITGIRPSQRTVKVSRRWYDVQKAAFAAAQEAEEFTDDDTRKAFSRAVSNYMFLLAEVLNGRWLYHGTTQLSVYRLPGYLPFRRTAH